MYLPKPLKGWRAFTGEVGVIVLGVLIALGAGQLVQKWQWQQQVKQAEFAFKIELETAVMNAYVRLATEPCLTQRLTEIETKLNQSGESWRGMPERINFPVADLAAAYHTYLPAPPISTNAWNSALANGIVNQFPTIRASFFAEAFDAATRFRDDRREEGMMVTQLAPLATDRKLTSDNRITMLQAVRRLQHLDDMIRDDSEAIIFTVKQTGIGYNDDSIRSTSASLITIAGTVRGQCVTEPKILPGPPS